MTGLGSSPAPAPSTGPTLQEPGGYAVVTFISTVMLVAGIGLAWTGLLLAGAGFILGLIEFRELRRLNPWIMPSLEDAGAPIAAKQPMRISFLSTLVLVIGCVAALVAVQVSGDALYALPPAIVTGAVVVLFNRPMKAALEAAAREPRDAPREP